MINNINYDTYLNLTNQLLNCSSGEDASKILNNNKFLINSKLVITLVQRASLLFSQNEENYADVLLDIAVQLAKILQLPEFLLMLYPSELEAQGFLLGQLIQAAAPGNVNFEIVDSLLFCNLDKLDEKFIKVLKEQVVSRLLQAEPEQAQGIASAINNISRRIEILPIGNIANNLEIAINGYEIVQTVFTYDSFKEEWVKLQNHLGNAYRKRIIGDTKENLNCSIHYFKNVLDTDLDNNQDIWAGTQHNLGLTYLVYRDRIIDRRETHYLKLAIEAFNKTLTIYNQRDFLEQWSKVQYQLGVAYNKHIEIEVKNKAKYLHLAVTSFNHALEFFTFQNVPEKWATIQDSLGNAYSRTDESDNLKLALNYYSQALQVHTKNTFPEAWARTQRNIGHTYWKLNQINEAKQAFELALSVFTPDSFPWECLITANNLGDIAFQSQDCLEAMKGYDIAVQADEQRRSHIDLYFRKQEVLSETISVYANAAKASICANQLGKALEYLERSKTRNLVELLVTRDISPKGDIPETVIDQLGQLRRKIAVEQRRLEMEMGNQKYSITPLPLDRTYLNDLQRQLNELIQCEILPHDPNFSLTQKVKTITFEQIQNLLPNNETALIEWYILNDKFLTFVVTRHSSQPQVIESSAEDLQALSKRISAYLRLYYRKDKKKWWRNQLESRLQNLAEILHIDEIISHIPAECDRLIIIPHRFLHLLPLHALPLGNKQLENGQRKQNCLLDKFPRGVGYAPSCQLLQLSQNQQRPNFSQLFAIQNPIGDLSYTNLEVETIGSFFAESQVLVKQEATKAALNDNNNFKSAHCCHFSCHGDFNLASPLESALILADNERLTLAEIFALSLNQCRLITLSACETGIADPTSISDEYISLPSGFLYAGTPSVVSSLWTVNDLSTALLMVKFYQNLGAGVSVAVSLNQAQLWLRDVTKIHLEEWIAEHQLRLDLTLKMQLRRRFQNMPDDARSFQSPFYWAAFCAIGRD
ncbi:CHAT domain-containing protein [Nostoc sp.]|uniref:CHAT domain-containing protein n=1 Tax=Nostoc sp. TaxID=1180 RepID=UPI002FF85CA1